MPGDRVTDEPTALSKPLAAYYDEDYYAHYSHDGDAPYRRDQPVWMAFFGGVAYNIVAQLAPRTVLDAGCAVGLLVEALRDRGVEAWGLDVSSFAVSQIREDVRAYCRVGSLTEDFDRQFDLITCIEVLEHLPPHDADLAVANVARHTDCVLLSSTPDEYREPTHLNVQPTDYWIGLFARHGLFRDLDFDASFVSAHAVLFRKIQGAPTSIIRAYERRYWHTTGENRALRAALLEANQAQASQASEIDHLQIERELLSQEVVRLSDQLATRYERSEPAFPRWLSWLVVSLASLLATWRKSPTQRVQLAIGRLWLPARAVSSPPPRNTSTGRRVSVLFISAGPDTSRRYRCDHQAESLRLVGWTADVTTYADASLAEVLGGYAAFVLHRVPYTPQVEWFMRRARQMGKPVIYDAGDLAFDPRAAHQDASLAAMSTDSQRLATHELWRNRQTLERADAVLVATAPLHRLATQIHGRVHLSFDAVSQAMLRSAPASEAGHDRETVTLAFVSGSAAPTRDFAEAAAAVRWALDAYPNVRLLVVGAVDLPDVLATSGDRVEQLPYQLWRTLQQTRPGVPINLAPLAAGAPESALRSAEQYLEAGALGVPTIASPNPDFARVISNGDNGFMADSTDAWKTTLGGLIESAAGRTAVGERAHEDVRHRHTTAARGYQLQALIGELLIERSALNT